MLVTYPYSTESGPYSRMLYWIEHIPIDKSRITREDRSGLMIHSINMSRGSSKYTVLQDSRKSAMHSVVDP